MPKNQHLIRGIIWMLCLPLNVLASGVAGPTISSALSQGATLVAAILSVVVWKEFKNGSKGVAPLISIMFIGYTAGLLRIGIASL